MEEYIQVLIKKEFIPGISILLGKKDQILYKNHFGWKSIFPKKELLANNTIYDLASLTKPLVTAFLVLYLLERDQNLNLNTKINRIIPDFPSEYEISLLQLLTHSSGLPSWCPFYLYPKDYLYQLKNLKLDFVPGNKVNYSCVGYILLYFIIERVARISFVQLAQQVIFKPLGLKHTFLKVPELLKEMTAPTEKGNHFERKLAQDWVKQNRGGNSYQNDDWVDRFEWRENIIQGETHDVNSYFNGGTAGNAGLFSTAEDMFILCQQFFPETASILKPESIGLFWKNFTPFKKSHRTIGFKRNSSYITSGGRALSRKAIGHNGFTGTSFWLDPKDHLVYILLTNRVHPEIKDFNYDKARRKIHQLLKKEYSTSL